MTERWITAKEAARLTSTSLPTIYRAARQKRLRGVKVNAGRDWRFQEQAIGEWMQAADAPHKGEMDGDDRNRD